MILLTPASVRRWRLGVDDAGDVALNLTLRGAEIVGVSGGETPMMPIRWPPFLTTTESAIRPSSRSACSTGSPVKSVLADRNGTPLPSPAMNCARRVGAEVVLVVADRDRVVAERRDRVRVIERAGAGVEALEGRAQVQPGEEVVARADRDRALVRAAPGRTSVAASARSAVQDRLEAGDAAVVGDRVADDVLGLAVVVVQQRQAERAAWAWRAASPWGRRRRRRPTGVATGVAAGTVTVLVTVITLRLIVNAVRVPPSQ